MSEVERYRAPRQTLPSKIEYARMLAASGMLPQQYRGRPENLLWAVEYAEMLGLPPMTAITGVHVIEGKPSASAGLISALVRRAGHRLRVTGDDNRAVAEIVRADDAEFTFRSEWTIERAQRAGIAGKGTWQKYPAAMLKARAISEVARDACEDALSGLHYTPEELGAQVDDEGVVLGSVEHRPDANVKPTQAAADGTAQALADLATDAIDVASLAEMYRRAQDEDALESMVTVDGKSGRLIDYFRLRKGELDADPGEPAATPDDRQEQPDPTTEDPAESSVSLPVEDAQLAVYGAGEKAGLNRSQVENRVWRETGKGFVEASADELLRVAGGLTEQGQDGAE